MYELRLSQDPDHMQQILSLQKQYLKGNRSEAEQLEEGFVTVQHNEGVLEKMNEVTPHAIALYDGRVVGYALAMSPVFRKDVPELIPMFQKFDTMDYQGEKLSDYLVMGQICIDKEHRKKGLFKQLYCHLFLAYHIQFNYLITEVSSSNTRSLEAHKAVGFKVIETYRDEIDEWNYVIWDWSSKPLLNKL